MGERSDPPNRLASLTKYLLFIYSSRSKVGGNGLLFIFVTLFTLKIKSQGLAELSKAACLFYL